MNDARVYIIILQYNNSEDTQRCLGSVAEIIYPNYEAIVVDNSSETKHFNSTRLFIENEEKNGNNRFKLIQAGSNLGYSGGNNVGIGRAIETGSDYILILNPDTTVEKDFLDKLIKAAESNKKIGILGPAMSENGHIVYGGGIQWLKPELRLEESAPNESQNQKTYVSGAAMLIKKEVIEKIGMLDERYFLYFEDADFCLRAQKAGFELKIVPEALIYHRPSSSTKNLGEQRLFQYHFRNAHLFNLKNGPLWVKIALPFWSFLIIIKQLIKYVLLPEKHGIASAIMAGVGDFYKRKFGKIND